MFKAHLFKIKEGKLTTWKEWCLYLSTHRTEVLETLKHEGWKSETYKLFQHGGDFYVLGMNHAMGATQKADKAIPLNVQHFDKLKECLESTDLSLPDLESTHGEILAHFEVN